MENISAQEAMQKVQDGAILIDIRGVDERFIEHIPDSLHIMPDAVEQHNLEDKVIIFYCRSGFRTDVGKHQLAKLPAKEAYLLGGGIIAWKLAGFPTVEFSDL